MNLFEYFRVFPIIIYTQERERERVYPFQIIYSSFNQGTEMENKNKNDCIFQRHKYHHVIYVAGSIYMNMYIQYCLTKNICFPYMYSTN